jgi:hypothetical protein
VSQPGQSRSVLRLTFSYEGDRVELVSRQRVQMTLPPSHLLDEGEDQSGFWFTVRAEDGRPLYRRVIQSPIRVDAEVFSPQPSQNIHRVAIAHPRGTFVLLVPDIAAARTLTLHMHPVQPDAQARPAREIARFPLAEPTATEG